MICKMICHMDYIYDAVIVIFWSLVTITVGMGDMGLKIYHDISGIYCDNDINDDNSGNPVS